MILKHKTNEKKEKILLKKSQNSNQTWTKSIRKSENRYDQNLVNSGFLKACMEKYRRFSFFASRVLSSGSLLYIWSWFLQWERAAGAHFSLFLSLDRRKIAKGLCRVCLWGSWTAFLFRSATFPLYTKDFSASTLFLSCHLVLATFRL